MAGFVVEGVGIIVAGLSLGSLVELTSNSSDANVVTIYTNFFRTLEAGIIVAGVGAILLGVGIYVESRSG